MALLHETEAAFAELAAQRQYEFGMHRGLQPKVGARGLSVGEAPFDPARHLLTDINPLSIMEAALDHPHVSVVLPDVPLDVAIITQHDGQADDPRIAGPKHQLGMQLRQSLEQALPRVGDRVSLYHIGEADDIHDYDGVELIKPEADPVKNAAIAADICRSGLTFVISNFSRRSLPMYELDQTFENTVAIKANHPLELAVPSGEVIRLGGSRETSTSADAADMNRRLDRYNQQLTDQLRTVGLAVAQVVFAPEKQTAFNVAATDTVLADALRTL